MVKKLRRKLSISPEDTRHLDDSNLHEQWDTYKLNMANSVPSTKRHEEASQSRIKQDTEEHMINSLLSIIRFGEDVKSQYEGPSLYSKTSISQDKREVDIKLGQKNNTTDSRHVMPLKDINGQGIVEIGDVVDTTPKKGFIRKETRRGKEYLFFRDDSMQILDKGKVVGGYENIPGNITNLLFNDHNKTPSSTLKNMTYKMLLRNEKDYHTALINVANGKTEPADYQTKINEFINTLEKIAGFRDTFGNERAQDIASRLVLNDQKPEERVGEIKKPQKSYLVTSQGVLETRPDQVQNNTHEGTNPLIYVPGTTSPLRMTGSLITAAKLPKMTELTLKAVYGLKK